MPAASFAQLKTWESRYSGWLFDAALPLWLEKGSDPVLGGFHECLLADGSPAILPRRARVQGRQSYVFALAGDLGWNGAWAKAAQSGLAFLNRCYRRPDGLYRTLVSPEGAPLDDAVMLYDQAFVLLANAWAHKTMPGTGPYQADARALRERIFQTRRHPAGGFWETGKMQFLSNPHMHLLEAALAWIEIAPDAAWNALADEIAALCLARFIDPATSGLHEYFDARWNIVVEGAAVEPGHQFEWAWLLERWARLRGRDDAARAARALFAVGARGVDPARHAAMDELTADLRLSRAGARLWPQTERLKAALLLAEGNADRALYLSEAADAALGLWGYLETPKAGLWRDKLQPDGLYVDEPAPASSLYHIACAIACLRQAAGV